jgi:hypothetical protein
VNLSKFLGTGLEEWASKTIASNEIINSNNNNNNNS